LFVFAFTRENHKSGGKKYEGFLENFYDFREKNKISRQYKDIRTGSMGRTDGGGTGRMVGGREGKGAKKKSKEYSAKWVRKRGGERGGWGEGGEARMVPTSSSMYEEVGRKGRGGVTGRSD
jgi:hypothetical protein